MHDARAHQWPACHVLNRIRIRIVVRILELRFSKRFRAAGSPQSHRSPTCKSPFKIPSSMKTLLKRSYNQFALFCVRTLKSQRHQCTCIDAPIPSSEAVLYILLLQIEFLKLSKSTMYTVHVVCMLSILSPSCWLASTACYARGNEVWNPETRHTSHPDAATLPPATAAAILMNSNPMGLQSHPGHGLPHRRGPGRRHTVRL